MGSAVVHAIVHVRRPLNAGSIDLGGLERRELWQQTI
jgi:hypothetical protein